KISETPPAPPGRKSATPGKPHSSCSASAGTARSMSSALRTTTLRGPKPSGGSRVPTTTTSSSGCACGAAQTALAQASNTTRNARRLSTFAIADLSRSRASVGGLDPEHGALIFVRQDVQELVRPHAHVANALPQVDEQHLAPQLLHVLVEQDALHVAGAGNLAHAQAADEHVALPARELVARVERQ